MKFACVVRLLSEKRPPGKLAALLDGNPDTTVHLAILLLDEWLLWARRGDQSGTLTCAARLKGLRVKVFQSRRTNDLGLEISAFIPDAREFVRGNLQLGAGPDAQKFCKAVTEAVLKLNPPVKRKLFGLTRD